MFIAPLLLYTYNYFNPASVIANLYIVPLITVSVSAGILMILMQMTVPFMNYIFGGVQMLFQTFLIEGVKLFANFPSIRFQKVPVWIIVIYYAAIISAGFFIYWLPQIKQERLEWRSNVMDWKKL